MIRRMDLAWISVKDIEKARAFFVDILGLKVKEENKEYGWLELAATDEGVRLGIGQCTDVENLVQPGSNAIMTMTVDDIVIARKILEQKNVIVIGDIFEVPGMVKMLFFTDADGNKFQLVQLL